MRVHEVESMTENLAETADRDSMNGFDAYEYAWDGVSKHLWSVLRFNLPGFVGCAAAVLIIYFLTVSLFDSWVAFYFMTFFLFLFLLLYGKARTF